MTIPKRIDENGAKRISEAAEIRLRWLVAKRYWLRPHRIARLEISPSDSVSVVVKPVFGDSERTLLLE